MAEDEIDPDSFRRRRADGEDLFLLDVREPAEVAEWSFPDAVNIPLGELGARSDELPTEMTIVVACHSGVRSATATEALRRGGWHAQNLAGGAVAWEATRGGTP